MESKIYRIEPNCSYVCQCSAVQINCGDKPVRWLHYCHTTRRDIIKVEDVEVYDYPLHWDNLSADEENGGGGDADGNVAEKPTKSWGPKVCECGAEATYGEDATHSAWCPKSKAEAAPVDMEHSCL